MTKWLPPLTCPIPKSSKCHYTNDDSYITRITDPNLVPRSKKLIWYIHQVKNKPPEYGQAAAFYRVFAKRSADKLIKPSLKIMYVLFDADHEFVAVIKSFARAKQILDKGFAVVEKMGRKKRVELKPGSYLLKTLNGRVPVRLTGCEVDDRSAQIIATKKCQACPNQKSNRDVCSCQFWGSIRDGTRPWQFLSLHEIRTKRRRTKQDSTLKARVGLH